MQVKGWHGTTEANKKAILTSGFCFEPVDFSKSSIDVPGDLGQGVYFFIDFVNGAGKSNAFKYAHEFRDEIARKQACSISVITVDIECNDESVLDLDDEDNLSIFYEFKEKFESSVDKIVYRLKDTGASRRKNYDGIIIELFISKINEQSTKKNNQEVKVVSKKTFTKFNGQSSNFHNGHELSVRELECIKILEEGEENGNEFKELL